MAKKKRKTGATRQGGPARKPKPTKKAKARKVRRTSEGEVVGTAYSRPKVPTVPATAKTARLWVEELSEIGLGNARTAERTPMGICYGGTITLRLAAKTEQEVDHAMRWFADILFPSAIINGRMLNPISLGEALGQGKK